MPSSHSLHQPPCRVPLDSLADERVEVLGVIGLRCRLNFYVERGNGWPLIEMPFVVDSGASFSFVGLDFAQSRGFPVPPPESEVVLPLLTSNGVTPIRVRPGRMRLWWHREQHGYPFDWPVLFRVGAPLGAPSVLGLGGVVKTCRWTFDGEYAAESPYGTLALDDTR